MAPLCGPPCSDGNLVATLMSQRMNITQCTIAHALEKTKYEDAGKWWSAGGIRSLQGVAGCGSCGGSATHCSTYTRSSTPSHTDIYWESMDKKYHFSCQFTADIIAMNTSDFIITSTYQVTEGCLGLAGEQGNPA